LIDRSEQGVAMLSSVLNSKRAVHVKRIASAFPQLAAALASEYDKNNSLR
jgi:hypothetical protein